MTNKYQRNVPSTTIDVYDVLQAWEVTNPAIQHAIKKLLQPGARGSKSRLQDIEEAAVSIRRAIEMERPAPSVPYERNTIGAVLTLREHIRTERRRRRVGK